MPTIEELAQSDAVANQTMADDPNWTATERQQYRAAFTEAKEKQAQDLKK